MLPATMRAARLYEYGKPLRINDVYHRPEKGDVKGRAAITP